MAYFVIYKCREQPQNIAFNVRIIWLAIICMWNEAQQLQSFIVVRCNVCESFYNYATNFFLTANSMENRVNIPQFICIWPAHTSSNTHDSK